MDHSEDGFFVVVASERMQRSIAAHYATSKVTVYNYMDIPGGYSLKTLKEWIDFHPQSRVFFFFNTQLAVQTDADIQRLNFSRDLLSRFKKIIVFFVTQTADAILARKASDFYTAVKMRLAFNDEAREQVIEPLMRNPLDSSQRTITKVNEPAADTNKRIPKEPIIEPKIVATKVKNSINVPVPNGGSLGIERRAFNPFGNEARMKDPSDPTTMMRLFEANALINEAKQLKQSNCCRNALSCTQKAYDIRKNALGEEHKDTVDVLQFSGDLYIDLFEYGKALTIYQKVLAIRKSTLSENHLDTASSYNAVAGIYDAQGDTQKALEGYQRALNIREKLLPADHPDIAESYANIAGIHVSNGDYEKALDLHKKALSIRVKALGAEHADTAMSYNKLAAVYGHLEDYRKALGLTQKSLSIAEKVLGMNHPDTASMYNNIAGIYYNLEEYPKALEGFQRALSICVRIFGENHPDTATSYNNIAGVHEVLGEYGKAVEGYQKALSIFKKVLGEEHPDTAVMYNNIAYAYDQMGDYGKASEGYKTALAILERTMGKRHPYIKMVRDNIRGLPREYRSGGVGFFGVLKKK